MERRARMTPMKAHVTLDDVAESVVTAETIVVDGGFTATT